MNWPKKKKFRYPQSILLYEIWQQSGFKYIHIKSKLGKIMKLINLLLLLVITNNSIIKYQIIFYIMLRNHDSNKLEILFNLRC